VEAAVGSPWEAAGSHTAEAEVGRSRAVAGIGLEEGCCCRTYVSEMWSFVWLRLSPSQSGTIAIAKEMELELELELTRMIAGGIAVAAVPGCSSPGWPFCLPICWCWVYAVGGGCWMLNAGFLSIGCACASARAIISSLSHATWETVAVASRS
jgi:hypothetical protein